MNYQKHYQNLINRSPKLHYNGRTKKIWKYRDGEYREAHRILPGCFGGTYDCNNVVYLIPEEHYIAHLLLAKIYKHPKLYTAAILMTTHDSNKRIGNKKFGWIKRELAKIASIRFKNLWKNEEYRKRTITNMIKERNTVEAKERIKNCSIKSWKQEPIDSPRRKQIKELQKTYNKNTSNVNIQLWKTENYRQKMSNTRKGMVWWTNGIIDIKSKKCPEGFKRGHTNPIGGWLKGRKRK